MEPSVVPGLASSLRFLPDCMALVPGFPSWNLGSSLEQARDSLGKGVPRLHLRIFIPVTVKTIPELSLTSRPHLPSPL